MNATGERGAAAPESMMVSALVPAWNEAESLPALQVELAAALDALGRPWEVVYIDDGSRDGTDRVIEQLCAADPRVRGVSFRGNYGKSAALATGFKLVRGRWVVTLDADLQDDPAELSRLFAALEENNLDLVSGWKQQRRDPWTKRLPSKVFNLVTSRVVGLRLHDFNCGFKLYRREVTDALHVYGELHRFLPALAHWAGFRVGEVPVHHRPRLHGQSKFGARRFVTGFLDLLSAAFISNAGLKPLHFFGTIGLSFAGIGGLMGLGFLYQWLTGVPMRARPLMLLAGWLALTGMQFIVMGLLGEMIANLRAHSDYPLRRRYNLDDEA
jgi:glycosyltransferase involved in cell wall biosynthesis